MYWIIAGAARTIDKSSHPPPAWFAFSGYNPHMSAIASIEL